MRPGGSGWRVAVGAPRRESEEPADAPAPPRAVRRLRAGRQPGDRDRGGGGGRRLWWFGSRADRTQGVRRLSAGQDA
ncbi:hypothetical protein G6F60_014259 [Rhizopus arrhizus]|nr:hypothetical protein G6F60_014259 [Rhizopus arrhizus]